jgi:predicted XRE-type DNA-binding protein
VQAENLKLRSSLMVALKRHIERKGLSQAEAAKVFGVTQPRISNLMRGKIELFGLDMLVNMLATAGMRVTMRVKKAA